MVGIGPCITIPRSIIWLVLAVAAVYALTKLSLIAVVPWRVEMHSTFIVTDFMKTRYGARAAAIMRHLAHMMTAVPRAVRERIVTRHNFDQIAYRTVPAGTPSALAYVMADYVAHLEHHFRQILGTDWESRHAAHPGIADPAPDVS